MFDKHYVGLDITGFENNGKIRPISRVTLLIDDENSLTAGDDTGSEISASCPHATQEMVNAILSQVKGYQYQMYSADAANIDPAAELGDGVTVSGIYSVISRTNEGGRGYCGLSAPGEAELEDEYPSEGPATREFNRKIAETRSTIAKTAEEIRLEVENELDQLSASFTVQLDNITARVDGLDGEYAELKLTVDGMTVTDSSGTTRIRGSSIDTTTIKANSISAYQVNLTGSITFGDLSSSVQNDINDAWGMAYDAQSLASDVDEVVSGWTYGGTTYIDGNMLMTNTVRASTLEGGSVALLTNQDLTGGILTTTGASSATYAVDLTSYGALRLTASYGDVFITSDAYGTYLSTTNDSIVAGSGHFRSSHNGAYSCGSSTYVWSDVYAANATIQTSDLTKKHDVVYGLEDFDGFFDSLKVMSFIFNDATSGRRHHGLGAQDVEQVLLDRGFTSMDFAGLIKSPKRDEAGQIIEGEYDYALRYGEFIPMCIEQIQKLKQRVSALEGTV